MKARASLEGDDRLRELHEGGVRIGESLVAIDLRGQGRRKRRRAPFRRRSVSTARSSRADRAIGPSTWASRSRARPSKKLSARRNFFDLAGLFVLVVDEFERRREGRVHDRRRVALAQGRRQRAPRHGRARSNHYCLERPSQRHGRRRRRRPPAATSSSSSNTRLPRSSSGVRPRSSAATGAGWRGPGRRAAAPSNARTAQSARSARLA